MRASGAEGNCSARIGCAPLATQASEAFSTAAMMTRLPSSVAMDLPQKSAMVAGFCASPLRIRMLPPERM